MDRKRVTEDDILYFKSIEGIKNIYIDEERLNEAASDETEDLKFLPEVVIQPQIVSAISKLLAYCNEQKIPVTPRGAGTGLSGGALAVYGGVVLDMKLFDKILNIDKENFQVIVESGVITQVLQEAVLAEGMFYPPDPASKGSCFIGGNIAESSGGPKAVKYGVVKDYVLNLEMVLPNGEVIWTGANVLKNATGYNLTQLVVGSEGTLGIVTKIVLRLIPSVQHDISILVPFKSAMEACKAVNDIFLAGYTPSGLEFMEREALVWAIKYTGDTTIPLVNDVQAHLLIEVDGNNKEQLYTDIEGITEVLNRYNTGDILFADSEAQKDALWNLRRKVGEAVKSNSVYKEEDTVVPRAKLPDLLRIVKEVGVEYGFQSVCYGHAGDGNLHINIVKGSMTDNAWKNELSKGIEALFGAVAEMGGTISGEHGIGYVQKQYMHKAFSQVQLDLMKGIKKVFDPNGILNPGKVFPD